MDIFKPWPKIPRVENRKEFYTEKIDGTNACIVIQYLPHTEERSSYLLGYWYGDDGSCYGIWAQSRNKMIKIGDDNAGFAGWVVQNIEELKKLGEGYHYGEWWGKGIQRGYDVPDKRFSLFNVKRWGEHNPNTPSCCSVVPTIHANTLEEARTKLIEGGSLAAPGYMNVEGVIVYEVQTDSYWKSIINKPKGG